MQGRCLRSRPARSARRSRPPVRTACEGWRWPRRLRSRRRADSRSAGRRETGGGRSSSRCRRRTPRPRPPAAAHPDTARSEEHTSELQSLMRISYDVFCLKKKKNKKLQIKKLTKKYKEILQKGKPAFTQP